MPPGLIPRILRDAFFNLADHGASRSAWSACAGKTRFGTIEERDVRPLAPETLIDTDALAERIGEMADDIARDTPEDAELAVLIVLKGAFVFGADLLRRIDRRTRIGFLETHKDPERPGRTDFVLTHPFSIENSDLLIVEDILDSGVTLRQLQQRLRARRPKRLRTAVLLDKTARRTVDVPVEYIGFEIPDRWVVGFGLDDEEAYRNLPFVGWVEQSPNQGS